ncbi:MULTISPECIES: HAD-IA family hydrolase [unclassified Meridianimarinicoccus]|uniref:HAD-IA family hydrolase n=1 Tax=unclassified Meridianimarinicoccus TaxID=2923344 RepID=UPI001867C5FB|nr:HAD-IA family hydrolase [Fluviibacterium sp. MJW13]
MSSGLKLAIFDVDGTLVDSQAHILRSMTAAFDSVGREMPERGAVLELVGLSLPLVIARLCPDLSDTVRDGMVATYKDTFAATRVADGAATAPLYPDIAETLDRLARVEPLLLGVATGKSRRGLTHVLDQHGLNRRFVTQQVADDHPSKPHPAMLEAALRDTGCDPADAVMIGDTVFDLEMARSAGIPAIAVGWGYHPVADLQRLSPRAMVQDTGELAATILDVLGVSDD